MTPPLEAYVDALGVEMVVGDRVRMAGWPWEDRPVRERPVLTFAGEPLSAREAEGVVTRFEEADGDVDDEGRSVTIAPRAHVRFDDGTEDRYSGRWLGRFWEDDAPFQFEDLEKIASADA